MIVGPLSLLLSVLAMSFLCHFYVIFIGIAMVKILPPPTLRRIGVEPGEFGVGMGQLGELDYRGWWHWGGN